MLGFLQQPYVFALVTAVLTAILVYFYSKITDGKDGKTSKSTFFKTLAAGLAVGMGLAWLSAPRAETIATEPFDVAVNAPGGI